MKQLYLSIVCFSIISISFCQKGNSYFQININKSRGFEFHRLDYNSLGVRYSPGSGIGPQFEYGYFLSDRLSLGLNLCYVQLFGFQYENVNGNTNKTSVSFNRKSIIPKVDFILNKTKGKFIESFQVGTGISYNISGDLKRIENNVSLPTIKYSNPFGFIINSNLVVKLNDKHNFRIIGGMGYRSIYYSAKTSNVESDFERLNGSGLDFYVGFRKSIIQK